MKNINALYAEFKEWRKAHPDSIYLELRSWQNFEGKVITRWIVRKGVEHYRFFGDVVIETINGKQQLSQPITCATEYEAGQLCKKLNAKLVHDTEPELYAVCPSWRERYNEYYKHCKTN